jgi:hypothetical protein
MRLALVIALGVIGLGLIGQCRLGRRVLGEPVRAGACNLFGFLGTCCDIGRPVLGVFVCRFQRLGRLDWPWRCSTAEPLVDIRRCSSDPGDDWEESSDPTP